jgi:hypothetical protein
MNILILYSIKDNSEIYLKDKLELLIGIKNVI